MCGRRPSTFPLGDRPGQLLWSRTYRCACADLEERCPCTARLSAWCIKDSDDSDTSGGEEEKEEDVDWEVHYVFECDTAHQHDGVAAALRAGAVPASKRAGRRLLDPVIGAVSRRFVHPRAVNKLLATVSACTLSLVHSGVSSVRMHPPWISPLDSFCVQIKAINDKAAGVKFAKHALRATGGLFAAGINAVKSATRLSSNVGECSSGMQRLPYSVLTGDWLSECCVLLCSCGSESNRSRLQEAA